MMIYVYYCVNKRCREHHREWQSTLSPASCRVATGRPVLCSGCGQPVRLVRQQELPRDGRGTEPC